MVYWTKRETGRRESMAETIMVVEDDRQMARELVRLLENYGYRALQVEDFSRAAEEILEACLLYTSRCV